MIFFGMLVFGYVYVWLFIPETKGLSLEEVRFVPLSPISDRSLLDLRADVTSVPRLTSFTALASSHGVRPAGDLIWQKSSTKRETPQMFARTTKRRLTATDESTYDFSRLIYRLQVPNPMMNKPIHIHGVSSVLNSFHNLYLPLRSTEFIFRITTGATLTRLLDLSSAST